MSYLPLKETELCCTTADLLTLFSGCFWSKVPEDLPPYYNPTVDKILHHVETMGTHCLVSGGIIGSQGF